MPSILSIPSVQRTPLEIALRERLLLALAELDAAHAEISRQGIDQPHSVSGKFSASPQDHADVLLDPLCLYVVSGAGGMGRAVNGTYMQVGDFVSRPKYKKIDGESIIYFRQFWKLSDSDRTDRWLYSLSGSASEPQPPMGDWTTFGFEGAASIAPAPSIFAINQEEGRAYVLRAVARDGCALQHITPGLAKDHEIALVAVRQSGLALQHVAVDLQDSREIVLAAVQQNGEALQYASSRLRGDCGVVLAAVTASSAALRFADATALKDNAHVAGVVRDIWIPQVKAKASALATAPDIAKANAEVVLAAAEVNATALEYAANALRGDREFMRRATDLNVQAVQFGRGGAFQHPDLMRQSGLLDDAAMRGEGKFIVFSVKFSLGEKASRFSSVVHEKIRHHPAFGAFRIYNPNSVCLAFCGPNEKFTDLDWQCRGDCGLICKWPHDCQNIPVCGSGPEPTSHSCWRYSFRWHQEKAKESGGYMLQVVERPKQRTANDVICRFAGETELGKGQVLEREMADQVGLSVFKVVMPENWYDTPEYEAQLDPQIDDLASEVRRWLDCRNTIAREEGISMQMISRVSGQCCSAMCCKDTRCGGS